MFSGIQDKLQAKYLWSHFLYTSVDLLLALEKQERTEQLIHYGTRHLFPAYGTTDDLLPHIKEAIELFECWPPANLRELIFREMTSCALS